MLGSFAGDWIESFSCDANDAQAIRDVLGPREPRLVLQRYVPDSTVTSPSSGSVASPRQSSRKRQPKKRHKTDTDSPPTKKVRTPKIKTGTPKAAKSSESRTLSGEKTKTKTKRRAIGEGARRKKKAAVQQHEDFTEEILPAAGLSVEPPAEDVGGTTIVESVKLDAGAVSVEQYRGL